ncbi:DUF3169 family protein [Macrococcoides goetzii]|nr:DUF3169 family protein [Macrococcus goetzii]TDM47929.1 DUF3169 family protein [Macrococcus goetzii]TDM50978.1 DUF3169 family protein [Macrococcus goetzii]
MNKFNKNEKKNIVLYALFGAMVGGLIGHFLPKINGVVIDVNNHINFNIMLFIVPMFLIIGFILYFNALKQFNLMNKMTSNDEDKQYIYKLSKYNKASNSIVNANTLMILSITLGIAAIQSQTLDTLIAFIILYIFVIILLFLITKLNRKILKAYPAITNSDFDFDYGDKKLLFKMIDHIDEGERLVMLHSLAATYQIIIIMLSFIMLLLGIYQGISGENQYLAIGSIALTMIVSTVVYYKKSEEFNK